MSTAPDPQDERDARIAELEREVRQLRAGAPRAWKQDLRSPIGRFENFINATRNYDSDHLGGIMRGGNAEATITLGDLRAVLARLAELEARPDEQPQDDDTPHAERLAQIRERNRRLLAVPFETHGGGHGPGCIPCELVRAVDDVRWLLEQLKAEYGVQRQGSDDASPADDEASARMYAGLYRTPHYVMQRFVTGWQRADAEQQPEDGDRG